MNQMSRTSKVLTSLLMVGLLGAVAGMSVFSAFSSTTSNDNNSFAAGSVTIGDNDSNQALYTVSNQRPGQGVTKCIKVTFTGTLASDVHIYSNTAVASLGPLAPYVNLTITPGTQSSSTFPDCTGFTPDSGGALYTGTVYDFVNTKNSYANGVVDYPGSTSSWLNGNSVVYQFDATLSNSTPDSVQGATTNAHSYVWEAHSQ
jgi:hypothetical protein